MKSIQKRLKRIQGQVGGIQRMVDEGAYCMDTLTQIAAVRAALSQVAAEIAMNHVQSCVMGNHPHSDAEAMTESQKLDELRTTLNRVMRS